MVACPVIHLFHDVDQPFQLPASIRQSAMSESILRAEFAVRVNHAAQGVHVETTTMSEQVATVHVTEDGKVKHRRFSSDETVRWQKALQL